MFYDLGSDLMYRKFECVIRPDVTLCVKCIYNYVYSDLLLQWCFTSTETIGLIRDGRMKLGEEGD